MPRAHYARADHRRMHDFLRRVASTLPFCISPPGKNCGSNSASRRFRRVRRWHRAPFAATLRLNRLSPVRNHFERARRRGISARTRSHSFSVAGGSAVRLSLCEGERLASCYRAISFARLRATSRAKRLHRPAQVLGLLRGIKFAFHNHFRRFFRADQTRQARAPPQAGIKPSVVSGKPIRVAGSSHATRQSHASVIS